VPPLIINEILVDPPGTEPGQGAVEVKSILATETLDAAGISLCTESSAAPGTLRCYTIPAGTAVPPSGLLVVRWNASGMDTSSTLYTGPFQELDPAGGVLLLLLTPKLDVNNLIDYVRWGNGSTEWEILADQRHLWPGDDSVGVSRVVDGSSIAVSYVADGAEAYRVDRTPSIGEENEEPDRDEPFRRADCNDDGRVDISDAIKLFTFLFLGGHRSLCGDSCDSNDDSSLDISDPVYILNFLFRGGPSPPAPGPEGICGHDETDDVLSCDAFLSCA
jgi:hypothetical protein